MCSSDLACDKLSFAIGRGEIFGFLGSNGCGKTTTMKVLTGLMPATEGSAKLLGNPVNAATNGEADLVHRREVAETQGQVVGFDGDVGVVAFPWRDYQRLVVVGAVALEVGEGFVQFAAGCRQRRPAHRVLSDSEVESSV